MPTLLRTLTPKSLTLMTALAAMSCASPRAADPIPQDVFADELGIDLSRMERTESGLYVQTLRRGHGEAAEEGDNIVVHYEGWLPSGTKFESSRARHEPIEIPLGMGVVIAAWDEGLVGMRVGELRRLVVPPELGYGARGSGNVPPDTPMVFQVELMGVK
jgi:FKBP-type peptidyl-prolyl cis-trans isomerase FkpA